MEHQRPEQPGMGKIPRPNNQAAKAARRELRRRRLLLRLGLIALAVLLVAILELRIQTVREDQRFQRDDAYFTRDDLGAAVLRDVPAELPEAE